VISSEEIILVDVQDHTGTRQDSAKRRNGARDRPLTQQPRERKLRPSRKRRPAPPSKQRR
jgi:hypothetical protein